MSEILKEIIGILDKLSTEIREKAPHNNFMNSDNHDGWEHPPLGYNNIVEIIDNLALKFKNIDYDLNNKQDQTLIDIKVRLDSFYSENLDTLLNRSHVTQGLSSFLPLIIWIESMLVSLFDSPDINMNRLIQRKQKLEKDIEDIEKLVSSDYLESLNNIFEKIRYESEALIQYKDSIENLKKDIDYIKTKKNETDKFLEDLPEVTKEITDAYQSFKLIYTRFEDKNKELDSLIHKSHEAYKIATTTGLAGAFHRRANKLSYSMWGWVSILIVGLIVGGVLGYIRFNDLNSAIKDSKDIGYIWLQVFLSVLSFGAPIWIAWVATKQINQTFKLSEDYAFKASVAKAYEGYKKEAENIDYRRIDSELADQLFASTLKRFDESPLRFTESQSHNSPLHEFLDSKEFKNFLKEAPDYIIDLISKIKGISITKKPSISKEDKTDKKEDKE
ncbi:MAG: hypothetical protein MUC49_09545 [Raineya sp.]|jgi:hypothetical protein|nr:hypothetical protein [Raineya sp.]